MRPLFRITPAGPVTAYQTFAIEAPLSTHWRKATCEEVKCPAFFYGWESNIDVGTELGQSQANYIRRHSGRSFTEESRLDGTATFHFPPGQTCFDAASHRVRLERNEIYIVRGGDWRGNPTRERRVHTSAGTWVEEFAEHQDALARRIERG